MTKPLIADTRWAVDGTDADASNVAAPPSGLRDTGYPFGAIPASSFDNFWQNRAYRWFQYLNAGNLVGNHTISGSLTIGGQAFSYPTATFTASAATDLLTITSHGFVLGDGPLQVSNSGGALPSELTAATNYWVIPNDANTFKLASSFLAALAGIGIDLLTDGTGTQSIVSVSATRPADVSIARTLTVTGPAQTGGLIVGATSVSLSSSPFIANSITDTMEVDGHGLLTGDGPFRVANSGGALPVPLVAATNYWIIRTSQDKFSLATTRANAIAGFAINLTTTGTGTNSIVSFGATRTGDGTVSGRLTVGGWVTQDVQTTVVPHTASMDGNTGAFEVLIPNGTTSGHGWYSPIAGTAGRTIVGVRAYVADNGVGNTVLVGLAVRNNIAFLGAPPLGTGADVAGTLSAPSAGTAVLEVVQKTGLSIVVAYGFGYYMFARMAIGTGGRLDQFEYDWI